MTLRSKRSITLILFLIGFACFFKTHQFLSSNTSASNTPRIKTSGAGQSMDAWYFERAYPNVDIPVGKYVSAFNNSRQQVATRSGESSEEWESLGPENIGGRTLCLAFHPSDPDLIFAGSASGGLWKTNTQGVGEDAWEFMPTGFPVLGVAAIAIDPSNPDVMLIGTGETYGVNLAEPGIVNRYTRGSYGIGILKSSDGGESWSQVLSFEMDQIKGVQDIEIASQNPLEMYAATTDGVYQSLDGGDNWTLIFNQINCIDIEIDPTNSSVLYVSQGNFNFNLDPNLSGIFKSTNKGGSFTELLDPGLITAWSGNAKLAIDPGNSNTIYVSAQVGWFNTDPTTPGGLYRSTNAGANWSKINNQNIAQFQGWYAHDFALNPSNSDEVMYVGIDAWKSTDGGNSFIKKSSWLDWTFGEVSVEVPEGGDTYVHADIHAVYYHPLVANKVFFATDGGVFSSEDGGEKFVTHNGGLQTTQFYANMGSSASNPDFCIGGTQDNATYIYKGSPSWWRVIGGDGMSAAVKANDDQIVFGSYQGLNIQKSTDGGDSFFNARPILVANDFTAFSGPYEIAPSNNDIMYAGGTFLYKSTDAADSWNATSSQSVDGSNVIVNIAISPINPDVVYVATSPNPFSGLSGAKVLKSDNGGMSFTAMNTLPNRVCKDIEIDPLDDDVVYAVFSGFGSSHVYRTSNGGDNWDAIDTGLPDVPTNTLLIDPLQTSHLYLGNDLGVYFSENSGAAWTSFNEALPEATMVVDLNESPSNRKIRIATHGRGIYQRDFVEPTVSVDVLTQASISLKLFPNPAVHDVQLEIELEQNIERAQLVTYNAIGQRITEVYEGPLVQGKQTFTWSNLKDLPKGIYQIVLQAGTMRLSESVVIE